MLYAILAYHVETEVMAWTPQADATVMTDLGKAHERINRQGRLGPAARLGTTQKARTLRGPGAGTVLDGPFAETKEQLLGLYIVEFDDEDGAIAAARELKKANPGAVYEIRPIALFLPGQTISRNEAPEVIRPD
ncbi:YciI family protein [Bradyrhizobium sp. ARR65]|uniref:YciI family protein n=1 Tax=Bradyrhizobium sp. ARR65 TaxID=1040989 RepID=UPI0004631F80|nr:YciI family protein [Bradyrhizobium sp. ARR65]